MKDAKLCAERKFLNAFSLVSIDVDSKMVRKIKSGLDRKRGISPIIASVLLIALVVVIVSIIALWARGFVKEAVQKSGKSAEQACGEISLDISVSTAENKISVSNKGNVAVYFLSVKKVKSGVSDVQILSEPLSPGDSKSLDAAISGYTSLEITPVILVEGSSSKKAYYCNNNIIQKSL